MLAEAIKFDDVDEMTLMIEHFDDLKAELGYNTVWSMSDTALPLDFTIFSNKQRIVTYKCIAKMGDTMDDVTWQTFTSIAKDGTIGGLWEAAENCFNQAKLALDDWHIYVEDFEVQDNGTLELVTGS